MADLEKTFKEVTEKQLQDACIEYLGYNGWLVAHFRAAMTQRGSWITAMSGNPGYPDLTAVKGHRHMFVELKREDGKVQDNQKVWLDELADSHSEVYLVRPSTMDVFFLTVNGDHEAALEIHWKNQ